MTADNDLLLLGGFARSLSIENEEQASSFERRTPISSLFVALSSNNFNHHPASCAAIARVSLCVLKSLQLQEGDVTVLGIAARHDENDSLATSLTSGVVVRLELMEEEEEMDLMQPNQHENIVMVPLIVITNLGLNPQRLLEAMEASREDENYPRPHLQVPLYDSESLFLMPATCPRLAQHVLLRPLGRPPLVPLYRPLGENGNNHNDQSFIYPSLSGALLQQGMICAVPDPRNSRQVLHYQVLQITVAENDQDDTPPHNENNHYANTQSQTTFELDSGPLSQYVPRLPPADLQASFYQDLWKNGKQHMVMPPAFPPPHPNLCDVAQVLLHPSPTNHDTFTTDAAISSRIFHVMGTDSEHDVVACVDAAAHCMGYHCLHIRGLAAFAYNQGHTPRVGGGLLDQLHGLQAALDYIQNQRRMEPCVLHLQAIDQELNALDEPLQHEQQDRFWMKLLDGLRCYENGVDGIQDANRNQDFFFTPSLLIVLSTVSPLKPGPWMERLIFPSVTLSTPDDAYMQYLWDNHGTNMSGNSDNSGCKFELTEEAMALLRGRPTHEIRAIREEVEILTRTQSADDRKSHQNTNATVKYSNLCKVCDTIDARRRKATSNISKISPVHWEDVGGLEHVRAEIMDAIELPLKHPHLFPSHTGRTGLLLFGPPGTGKTLVAKAVATECQLPFLSVKGPELLGSYVGESEANVRHVFASARAAAADNLPIAAAILFFDELDSLAPRRGGMDHGGGVMERVVASLLAELDGPGNSVGNSGSSGRVFVLGATNRPDLLDPSLLRPGRLDRLVYLGIPSDHEERARILASQLRKMKLDGHALQMASIVAGKLPPRLSGADMSKLTSGAMLIAVHRLCREAEGERQHYGNIRSIDAILEGWGEEQLTPVVTLDDLLLASKDVFPSVTEEEMQRYEQLRDVHKSIH
jgi:peroxin-6